jgi:hypothetical protein
MFQSDTSRRTALVADDRNDGRLAILSQGWNVVGGYRRCPMSYNLVQESSGGLAMEYELVIGPNVLMKQVLTESFKKRLRLAIFLWNIYQVILYVLNNAFKKRLHLAIFLRKVYEEIIILWHI